MALAVCHGDGYHCYHDYDGGGGDGGGGGGGDDNTTGPSGFCC